MSNKETKDIKLAAESIKENYPPLITQADAEMIKQFYKDHPEMATKPKSNIRGFGSRQYRLDEPWIQTYSGRRFTPTNPIVEAIDIEDIAHPLSMQCRWSGHVKQFYSVAQHSVLVSYLCDAKDALCGLLHDGSEAYLVDIPRPIKKSGKFDNYLEFEIVMQNAICERFGIQKDMPDSVKFADDMLLSMEARDLMAEPLHDGKIQIMTPMPFKIIPLSPSDAKAMFLDRFDQLTTSKASENHPDDIFKEWQDRR